MYKELYQQLYEDSNLNYGRASYGRCPGVRFIPYYFSWLENNIIDLGCGTGDTVKELKYKGFNIDGIDQIKLNNNMESGDITLEKDLSKYNTALCIDVFEHLPDSKLIQLIKNMSTCKKQVISVFSGSSKEIGYDQELHINIKSLEEWQDFINKYLNIQKIIDISINRQLYLCTNDFMIKPKKSNKNIDLFKTPGIRTFSNGVVMMYKDNKEVEKFLDQNMLRMGNEKRWRPFNKTVNSSYKELQGLFNNGCYIIGKGPSLDILSKEHFEPNLPIICINESIHKIESLSLENRTFCIQQDQDLKETCLPKKSEIFITPHLQKYYTNIKKYLYLPEQFNLRGGGTPTVCIVLKILESLDGNIVNMYAFDALCDGNCEYADTIGHESDYGNRRKDRFKKQKHMIDKCSANLELKWWSKDELERILQQQDSLYSGEGEEYRGLEE